MRPQVADDVLVRGDLGDTEVRSRGIENRHVDPAAAIEKVVAALGNKDVRQAAAYRRVVAVTELEDVPGALNADDGVGLRVGVEVENEGLIEPGKVGNRYIGQIYRGGDVALRQD